jgi:lactate permease
MILAFRRPPEQAAMAGVALVIILWIFGIGSRIVSNTVNYAILDTMLLVINIGVVIVSGLAFVILIELEDVNLALTAWIRGLGWRTETQVIFIVIGISPMLEAMTGFGVSLIVTVPLLLSLFERPQALRVALGGMGIMPWGILGLPTVIGAELAHLSPSLLGQLSAITSAPVFLGLLIMSLWITGHREMRAYFIGWLAWMVFIINLYFVNRLAGPEIAGVSAGGSVVVMGLLVSRLRRNVSIMWPRRAWPYPALLGVILVMKLVIAWTGWDTSLVIRGAEVSWKPLASPALALAIVTFIFAIQCGRFNVIDLLMKRASKPLKTTFFFVLLSQFLLKAGFLEGEESALSHVNQTILAVWISIAGGIGGYITGSAVSANALLMAPITHIGSDHVKSLAAIQNSVAGHTALGSPTVISIISGLSKMTKSEEQRILSFGFFIDLINVVLVAGSGIFLAYFI